MTESEQRRELDSWNHITRVERLGELLVRLQVLKLSQLTALMQEQQQTGKRLGELAVEKGLLTQDELVAHLITQIRESQVVDESLRELGRMTQEEKWERVSQHERLGEILIKRHAIKLSQLVDVIEAQKDQPEKHMGQLLVERGLITQPELEDALELQQKQSQTLRSTIEELHHHQENAEQSAEQSIE